MKYQVVVLNFDKRTVEYVPPTRTVKAKRMVTTTSGTNPPAPKKRS